MHSFQHRFSAPGRAEPRRTVQMNSPQSAGLRPSRNPGQGTGLPILGLVTILTLTTPVHAKEDFEPDNCFEQQGRPHVWNLCDFYAQRRLEKALERELPRALEKLDIERYQIPDDEIAPDPDYTPYDALDSSEWGL